MGNKTGHARKLDPADDTSASGLRDAPDFSIADPTDSQIIDEQELLDILESDSDASLDQSSSDGRDDRKDKDETALSRTYVLKPSSFFE